MTLSVVIVNYNVKHYLEQCLDSVCRAAQGLQVEVFVVDNLSTDGSIPYLRERYPNITFIENKENVGFARANNQAIRLSKGKYVLLLNPDTIVAEKTFADFITFMDTHPEAGAAGAYMLRTNGTFAPESRRGLPTPFVAFCKMSGLSAIFPYSRIFGKYYMRYLDENVPNEIEVISGAFMWLRREALDKAGLLDEDFFMYGEDIDLSYRIIKNGYKNYFLPSRMLHYKGESTEKSSYRYVYTFYEAMRLFFRKHYAHYNFLVSLPINLAIWARSFMAYMGNQFRHRAKPMVAPTPTDMLIIGDTLTHSQIKTIIQKHQLKGNHLFIKGNAETLPEGHLSQGIDYSRYNTVVYDRDLYTYEYIFKLLEHTPGNDLRIATYSRSEQVLITENKVYTLTINKNE